MQVDDIVGLRQPFRPTATSLGCFSFGKVVGIIPGITGTDVLVHLCNADGSQLYTDELGDQVIYSFRLDETQPNGDHQQNPIAARQLDGELGLE
ncbi:MAG: hypothetical protein AAF289_01790 [Cyanobacteria bacterium P01_A01_bin.135]